MTIIKTSLSDKTIQKHISIDDAILRLVSFSSIANRTPDNLRKMLESGETICTNFWSYRKESQLDRDAMDNRLPTITDTLEPRR